VVSPSAGADPRTPPRRRSGELHDLVMLAHFVDGTWASMDTVGLTDELSLPSELGREGSP
jgi:hypothetical protein